MSRETANAARYAKGLTVLTELEGELLEALEDMHQQFYEEVADGEFCGNYVQASVVIDKAHGE